MAEKLYISDPYLHECAAEVIMTQGNQVFLDRTVFFPEGGGQVGDTGWLGSHHVSDTQQVGGDAFSHPDFPVVRLGGEVAHVLDDDQTRPAVGDRLEIRLDWDRRYRIMRMHSAAHLAYHFITTLFEELLVRGARIDDSRARFDFHSEEKLDQERVAEAQGRANEIVEQALPITRSPLPEHPEAALWVCGEIQMPCGGTHVASSDEIGPITLQRRGQGRTLERLYINIQPERGER